MANCLLAHGAGDARRQPLVEGQLEELLAILQLQQQVGKRRGGIDRLALHGEQVRRQLTQRRRVAGVFAPDEGFGGLVAEHQAMLGLLQQRRQVCREADDRAFGHAVDLRESLSGTGGGTSQTGKESADAEIGIAQLACLHQGLVMRCWIRSSSAIGLSISLGASRPGSPAECCGTEHCLWTAPGPPGPSSRSACSRGRAGTHASPARRTAPIRPLRRKSRCRGEPPVRSGTDDHLQTGDRCAVLQALQQQARERVLMAIASDFAGVIDRVE